MNKIKISWIGLFIGFIPSVALANAGSPMIWFSVIHLLILNAIIGLIESSILRWYEFPHRTSMIIIANYISMIIGFYFIVPHFTPTTGHEQYGILKFIFGMVLGYLATLIIEFPLFYFSLKNRQMLK